VHHDDAAARTGGLAVEGRPGLPEAQEAHPVFGGPALEAHVGGQHGGASIAAACYWALYAVNAEQLFVRFFLPLYPPDARADVSRARTTDANPANNPSFAKRLDEAADAFVSNAHRLFGTDLALDRSDASVHRLSAALTPERRDVWSRLGTVGSPENVLFNAVVHGAAYVGSCVVKNHDASWRVRRPLWETLVRLRSRAGEGDLPVFHWWLKSLGDGSDAALDPAGTFRQVVSLADRYRTHVEVPCATPESLPPIVARNAELPRLKRPRYDSLHKYLRAHLPELRDLGEHFASAERFERFELRWLDFHLVGGGRMLLMSGVSRDGLHLFWLSATGFEKSAYLPCDAGAAPSVRVEGNRVVATTSERGEQRRHEMLWWGP